MYHTLYLRKDSEGAGYTVGMGSSWWLTLLLWLCHRWGHEKLRKLLSKGSLPLRNPGGLVCRRTAENSYDLGSMPGPLFPGRQSWQQPESLCAAPWARKRRFIGSPARGQSQLPLPELRLLHRCWGKGWSRAPGAAHGAGQETLQSWERPGQEPLTCASILGSQGGHGMAVAMAVSLPPGYSPFRLSERSSLGHLCSSGSSVCNRLQLCFPMLRTHCTCRFSYHCWSGQASCSSFQFIKRASAPPLASSNSAGKVSSGSGDKRTGVTTAATTAALCLQPLQLPSV